MDLKSGKSERGRSSISPSLPFTPIFSPEEELTLLEEYTEFVETNGEQVSSKWVKFLETSELKVKYNRRQIAKKMDGLQKRYEKIKSSSPSLSRPRLQQDHKQERFLELCESLWGGEGGKGGVKTDLPLVVAEPCFPTIRWIELQVKEIELYCQKLALKQKDCQLRLQRLRAEKKHGKEKSNCQPRASIDHLTGSQNDAELFEVAPEEEEGEEEETEEEEEEEKVDETEEEEEEEVDETEVEEEQQEEDETEEEEEVHATEEEEVDETETEEEVVETEEEEEDYMIQYRDLDEKVCEQGSYKSTKSEDGKNQEMDPCIDNGISSKLDTVIPGSKIVEDEELENKAVDDHPIVCVEERTENTQSYDGIEKAVVDGNTSKEAEVVQIDEDRNKKVVEVKNLESSCVIIEEVVAGDPKKSVIIDDVVAGEPNKRSLESGEIIEEVVKNAQPCDAVEKAVVDAGNTTKEVASVQVDEPSSRNKGRKRKLAEVKTLESPVIIEDVVAGDPKKRALESGVIIEEIVRGSSNKRTASKGLKVRVHVTGKVKNSGHIIESSGGKVPLTICLGNEDMIDGFSEGVEGMRIGGKRRIIIPPSMGFGEQGLGKDVPPNSWLEYEVELVGVRKCTDP